MPTAVFRAYLRAVRRLPVRYLRQFFAVRARTDLDAVVATPEPALRARKLADVARRVRRLQRATEGDDKAFNRVLALAYGRTGKLRWELLFVSRFILLTAHTDPRSPCAQTQQPTPRPSSPACSAARLRRSRPSCAPS